MITFFDLKVKFDVYLLYDSYIDFRQKMEGNQGTGVASNK